MPKGGSETKKRILDVAEQLVLEHGFAATSIDQILEKLSITKGAFFYHFKSKSELADALLKRYVERDDALLHNYMAKAEKLSRDPLQQLLIFIGLLEEMLRGLEQPHPGCIVASFLYQLEEFDVNTQDAIIGGFDEWHKVLDEKFRLVMEKYPARIETTPDQLVDHCLALFEGGMIMSKLMAQPRVLADQLKHFRNYIELLFGQI